MIRARCRAGRGAHRAGAQQPAQCPDVAQLAGQESGACRAGSRKSSTSERSCRRRVKRLAAGEGGVETRDGRVVARPLRQHTVTTTRAAARSPGFSSPIRVSSSSSSRTAAAPFGPTPGRPRQSGRAPGRVRHAARAGRRAWPRPSSSPTGRLPGDQQATDLVEQPRALDFTGQTPGASGGRGAVHPACELADRRKVRHRQVATRPARRPGGGRRCGDATSHTR